MSAAEARARMEEDALYDHGDDYYDDEDYGSSQDPRLHYEGDGGLVEGSGTYDDEDISNQSDLIR